jgi:hypothetical protein
MKADQFHVPFWIRWLGSYRAWKKAKADRIAHARYLVTPKLVGVISGKTEWTDVGYTETTHVWHLYETPSGVRTTSFTSTNSLSGKEVSHPLYSYVAEWKAGLRQAARDSEGKLAFFRR